MTHRDESCANCHGLLTDIDLTIDPHVACPQCGSTARLHVVIINEKIRAFDSLWDRIKRLSFPSKKKVRSESFTGYEISHARQKMVRKFRMFNKDTDEYVERVTDIETGEIIHECVEPLSKHVGHGTAKKKRP